MPNVAYGFRFRPNVTDGWVVTFSEDVANALGDQSGEALARLRALASEPVIPFAAADESRRLSILCRDLHEEWLLAREGHRLVSRQRRDVLHSSGASRRHRFLPFFRASM